jgi:protein tyrosine phosphatase (PTP) superfamily phosphohydrolase (DUF442 family)
VALAAFLLYASYEAGRRLFGWNFHTVIAGRVYRGAQPSARQVETLVKDYGVRTIINLRGCGVPADWYAEEVKAAQRLGVNQEDICLSPVRLPSSAELRRLVEVVEGAEYPVFLHCRRGADRTGLAAVIVKALAGDAAEGRSKTPVAYASGSPSNRVWREARGQLGWWYGHVAVGETGILDRFFGLYEEWLAKHGGAHTSATFRHWLLEEYKGGWCSARFEGFTPLADRARRGETLSYRVRVRNSGTGSWRMRAAPNVGMHLAYQVWDGGTLLDEGRGGLFDRDVPPGEAMEVTLAVRPLRRTGRFRLLVDMVEERHCWFYQAGSEPHEEELVVGE